MCRDVGVLNGEECDHVVKSVILCIVFLSECVCE